MTSTFHGLEIGRRSLYTQQTALSTTGHNIANANTPGYSRQRVNMEATSSITNPYQGGTSSELGTGVSVGSIERIRSKYLDTQYRERNAALGSESMKLETLQQIEMMSAEPGENGLNASLNKLWSAFEDLSANPDSLAARSVVVSRAQEVLDKGKAFNKDLQNLSESLQSQTDAVLKDIDTLSKQINELNKEVVRTNDANDVKDKRDQLIDELSSLIDVDVTEKSNGALEVNYDTANPKAGKLKGLGEAAALTKNVQTNLNAVFEQLAPEINTLAESGYSLVKVNGTMQQGKALFTEATGDGSYLERLSVSNDVKSNPANLAASSTEGTVSNGDLAAKISELKDKTLSFDLAGSDDQVDATTNDFYSMLISNIGSKTQSVERTVGNNETVLKSIESNRLSVSGVSLDEEMANLVQFQHAYNAAARYVSTTDEMLDVIINRMGV
ncbi:flagellar hook-associated protein FlgK [Alkalihalobacillus sp. CinArs1]|uniref:flagellar hook-associated protein FlgK n=1 Tax=Alkalihalobacillus sp. CinArs1 TaxID=2995314 RepID=UPI0022DDF3E5|nr:flagellar hook-associated protein FlgK [Alkalihalobacillus sp. CinArs1]